MKVLLIEDEPQLSQDISEYLYKEKFLCEVVPNFEDAHEKINLYQYDCVIVDIGLPDGNGLDIIRSLKKNGSETGIIIISAKNSLDDKITGLEIGADDYLTKPFHLSELNARIKSIIRRRSFGGANEIIFNEIRILPEQMEAMVNGQSLGLTKKEYDLLIFFISNKERVLTREAIAEHLWGDQMDMADSFDFIYTHIKNIRKKIIDKGGEDYIHTIYGMGYKFTEIPG
ncbi:MAG: response regulator transcription factor [Bacteroidetes bacterium]|nr:response regulator transcription factor [Bacteroidota bacterium]